MNKKFKLLLSWFRTKKEAKVKKQPLSAENALCLYDTNNNIFSHTPTTLAEMFEVHLNKVLEQIKSDARDKTYQIYYFKAWMSKEVRVKLTEALKNLGYIIKYQDENLYIVSWKKGD